MFLELMRNTAKRGTGTKYVVYIKVTHVLRLIVNGYSEIKLKLKCHNLTTIFKIIL